MFANIPQAWRALVWDLICLGGALGVLFLVMARAFTTAHLTYPDARNATGDYYRYINMALPHGAPKLIFQSPFMFRILVPYMVHLLLFAHVPYQISFLGITCLSMAASTVAIYYLIRGMGLQRTAATGAALAFITLQYAVAYNIYDFFLVDPPAHAFLALTLLAVQRRKHAVGIALVTVGALCKETMFLGIAVAICQLLIPALQPLSRTLDSLLRFRWPQALGRVPLRSWIFAGLYLLLPLLATLAVHLYTYHLAAVMHARVNDPSQITVWNFTIPWHLEPNVTEGLSQWFARATWGTFGVLFALALGAFPLRLWRQSPWSGWTLLVVGIIILYTHTVGGDVERMSINAWPFMIVLAALTIEALSRAAHIPSAILWALTLVGQILYLPLTGRPGVGFLGPLAPFALQHGFTLCVALSWLVALAVVLLYHRVVPPVEAGQEEV